MKGDRFLLSKNREMTLIIVPKEESVSFKGITYYKLDIYLEYNNEKYFKITDVNKNEEIIEFTGEKFENIEPSQEIKISYQNIKTKDRKN